METPAFRIGVPDWLNGIRHWGHKVTEEMEAEEPEAAPQPEPPADTSGQPLAQPEPAAPAITPVQVRVSRPRASFDVDLGPDHTEVKEGGGEPIEPLIVGPGGTFGRTRCARPPDLPRSPSYRTRWRPMHPISLQKLHSRCSLRQRKA